MAPQDPRYLPLETFDSLFKLCVRLSVDVAITTEGGLVMVPRTHPPFEGMWHLPGGFVLLGETLRDAVRRKAREEAGLEVEPGELVGVYDDPAQDPRGHVVILLYSARATGGRLKEGAKAFKEPPGSLELPGYVRRELMDLAARFR